VGIRSFFFFLSGGFAPGLGCFWFCFFFLGVLGFCFFFFLGGCVFFFFFGFFFFFLFCVECSLSFIQICCTSPVVAVSAVFSALGFPLCSRRSGPSSLSPRTAGNLCPISAEVRSSFSPRAPYSFFPLRQPPALLWPPLLKFFFFCPRLEDQVVFVQPPSPPFSF